LLAPGDTHGRSSYDADLAAGLVELEKYCGLFKHRSKAYDKKPLGPEPC
jgi:hypothetical protein